VLARFNNEITTHQLCKSDDSILLAVSGGIDSMVMAHLFLQAGYTMGVAHCNFQLRGKESQEDEIFVQTWCKQFNIPFHTKAFGTNNYAVENGISIQMAARELRYVWFKELMDGQGYTLLATAHHLNDNFETMILNLVRGTGLSGLRGIPYKSNNIIRPLINFTKSDLVAYAKDNKISWREDVTNASSDYDRNFIRHEVMPKLLELNPSLENGLARTHQRLLAAKALSQLGVDGLMQEFVVVEKDRIKMDKAFLLVTQYPVGVAWELIKPYGFNYSQCEDMVKASVAVSGKKFLSPSHQLVVDRDAWLIEPHQKETTRVIINDGTLAATLGALEMTIEKGNYPAISTDPTIAMLNAEKLIFPLIWRPWEDGDSFSPLGMNGNKKLSDFFIDIKLSLLDKQKATVIESNGEIVWIVGHRIDNRYKVTDQKKQIIKLSVQSHL
jgi:tRNA(Ile)-lysidine synthase